MPHIYIMPTICLSHGRRPGKSLCGLGPSYDRGDNYKLHIYIMSKIYFSYGWHPGKSLYGVGHRTTMETIISDIYITSKIYIFPTVGVPASSYVRLVRRTIVETIINVTYILCQKYVFFFARSTS